MRIQAINQNLYQTTQKRNIVKSRNQQQALPSANQPQVAFKGAGGGVFGFMTGGAAGIFLTALALTTPVGWVAGAALYGGAIAGSAVGAAVGNKLGDLVDPDDKKKNK